MKRLILLLFISSLGLAEVLELSSNQSITIKAINTKCEQGYAPQIEFRAKVAGKNIASHHSGTYSLSDVTKDALAIMESHEDSIEILSTCYPLSCYSEATGWRSFGVFIEQAKSAPILYRSGLKKKEAKALANQLVEEKMCGRSYHKTTYL